MSTERLMTSYPSASRLNFRKYGVIILSENPMMITCFLPTTMGAPKTMKNTNPYVEE